MIDNPFLKAWLSGMQANGPNPWLSAFRGFGPLAVKKPAVLDLKSRFLQGGVSMLDAGFQGLRSLIGKQPAPKVAFLAPALRGAGLASKAWGGLKNFGWGKAVGDFAGGAALADASGADSVAPAWTGGLGMMAARRLGLRGFPALARAGQSTLGGSIIDGAAGQAGVDTGGTFSRLGLGAGAARAMVPALAGKFPTLTPRIGDVYRGFDNVSRGAGDATMAPFQYARNMFVGPAGATPVLPALPSAGAGRWGQLVGRGATFGGLGLAGLGAAGNHMGNAASATMAKQLGEALPAAGQFLQQNVANGMQSGVAGMLPVALPAIAGLAAGHPMTGLAGSAGMYALQNNPQLLQQLMGGFQASRDPFAGPRL